MGCKGGGMRVLMVRWFLKGGGGWFCEVLRNKWRGVDVSCDKIARIEDFLYILSLDFLWYVDFDLYGF